MPTALVQNCLHENAGHSAAKVIQKHSLSKRLAQCLAGRKHSGQRWLSRALQWSEKGLPNWNSTRQKDCHAKYTASGQAAKQPASKPSQLNPASPTQPAHPIQTAPSQQATQTWQIVTNCMVFLKGSESLKHRKNTWILLVWKCAIWCLDVYVLVWFLTKCKCL